VKVLRTSPVAGFTLRYGTVSSFAVRVIVDYHTASSGMRLSKTSSCTLPE
jgi:hypothetical protein